MLKHLAALLIVLAFASQTLAGGFVCGKVDRDSARGMACCALAKSAIATPVAVICCQTACGESTGGLQSEAAAQKQLITPPVAHRSPAVDLLLPVAVSTSLRSVNTALLHRDPPSLFLQHSSFLI